jgi:Lysylphosphatidylglycerol synthase TM region
MFVRTNLRKGSSLFIKTAIVCVALYYIIIKIQEAYLIENAQETIAHIQFPFLLMTLLLVPINWGLEAYKWQVLIAKLESISFTTAYKSVLAGLSVGIITPNRIGEFAGKLLFLKQASKLEATKISFAGSFIQLLITLIIGGISGVLLLETIDNPWNLKLIYGFHYTVLLLCISLLITALCLFMYYKTAWFYSFVHNNKHYFSYELGRVWLSSFFRYMVFSVQFYFMLIAFNVGLDVYTALVLIALTFLFTTIIPSSLLSSVVVRSGVAVFFFSAFTPLTTAVLLSSTTLWLANIGIPALIGGVFLSQQKIVTH